MIDETSGPFRLLSGRGDAPVGYGAGTVSARRTGAGAWTAVGTFRPLVARYGLKNVPTPIEIIAELLACHAGALTNPRPVFDANVRPDVGRGPPSSRPRVQTESVLVDSSGRRGWPQWQADEMGACRTNRERLCLFACLEKPILGTGFARSAGC